MKIDFAKQCRRHRIGLRVSLNVVTQRKLMRMRLEIIRPQHPFCMNLRRMHAALLPLALLQEII